MESRVASSHVLPHFPFTWYAESPPPSAAHPAGAIDLMVVPFAEGADLRPLVATRFDERNAEVSHDGKWLAYESNESGSYEVYVRPFPQLNRTIQVSTNGGVMPAWSREGHELFFVSGRSLMHAAVDNGGSWTTPMKLFDLASNYTAAITQPTRSYDVSPDGKRFLMLKGDFEPVGRQSGLTRPAEVGIVVVQNWTEELKRLAPPK